MSKPPPSEVPPEPQPQSKKEIKVHRGFASAAVDHSRLVNNESAYTDVYFSWEQDSVSSAHYAVLKARGPSLLTEAKQNKKKKNTWTIDLTKNLKPTPNSTAALNIVLQYLYSGEIDFDTYNTFMATEVLAIGKAFKMEHIVQMNIKYIQEQLNDTNIFDVIKYAHKLEVDDIKAICIDYALMHPDFFTAKKAKEVGFELFQEATTMMVQHWTKKTEPKVFEKKVTALNTVIEDFNRLYSAKNETGDLVVKYGAKNDNGDIVVKINDKGIKAHKAVLSSISVELDALVGSAPSQVVLDPKYSRISERAFEALLKFLYYNDVQSMKLLYACQIHQFVMDFKLTRVLQMIEKQMEVLDCDNKSAVFLLDVAYTEMDHDKRLRKLLRKKGISHITENMDKIDFSPVESMEPVIGTDIVLALQKAIQGNWDAVGNAIKEGTKIVPISTNFPGSNRRLDSSEKSEAGDPSERSEGGKKSSKTSKKSKTKKDKEKD